MYIENLKNIETAEVNIRLSQVCTVYTSIKTLENTTLKTSLETTL